jgi:hypothetical protein
MKKSREINPHEVVDLYTPSVRLEKNHHSLWEFRKKTKSLVNKMKKTGEPLLLQHHERVVAIVSDPTTHEEIEKRRSTLVALIENIENKKVCLPRFKSSSETPGRVKHNEFVLKLKALIAKRDHLTDEINYLKCRLYDFEEKRIETDQQLRILKPT